MNNQGIVFFYRLMMATVIIILGIALAFPTKISIDAPRLNMSCAAPANDFDEATCYSLDFLKILTVGGIIMVGFFILVRWS